KRISSCIAKTPESQDRNHQDPAICWRKTHPGQRPSGDCRTGVDDQATSEEGPQEKRQRVEFERGDDVAVEQLMQRACGAATGTIQPGQGTKRTSREEAGAARLKKQKISRAAGTSQRSEKRRVGKE